MLVVTKNMHGLTLRALAGERILGFIRSEKNCSDAARRTRLLLVVVGLPKESGEGRSNASTEP